MVDSLLDASPYALDRTDREARLLGELTAAFHKHYAACAPFRKICDTSGWAPEKPILTAADLPFIPTQYFKEMGSALVSVPPENVYRSLASSATSGRPSTIVIDQVTARRQARAVVSALSPFIGAERRRMFICDVAPAAAASHEISARAAAMLGFMPFGTRPRHILALDGAGGPGVDAASLAALRDEVARDAAPVTIIGFTFLLYTALLEPLATQGHRIELPPGSSILHIGGWKKLEDRKVSRAVLAKAARDVFGIPADRIVDCYGFTEQMGTVYPECAAGRKHAPSFADVIVRDRTSLLPLPDGATGAGQFLSLVPDSYPGFSVLTDDIVRVLGRDDCPCGRHGTTFEVLGRDKSVEIRGCGDVIAEKLMFGRAVSHPETAASGSSDKLVEIQATTSRPVFWNGVAYRRFEGDLPFPPVGSWRDAEANLRAAQERLRRTPVDDILGLLAAASVEWGRQDGPFAAFHPQGLSFIVGLVQSGGLQQMVDSCLRGGRATLDGFRTDPAGGPLRLKAVPRGLAVHWLAGNVPTLGILSLLLSLVAKNANVLKVPEAVSPLLPEMLASLAAARHRTPAGVTIDGRLLTDATAALWVPHNSEDAVAISSMADARVVWGGADAVRSVSSLPKRWDAQDIVFGPKLSVAAVGLESLASESSARRAARGIAVDCAVFDQEACASAHTVFVEQGGTVTPSAFARILAEAMAKTVPRLAPRPPSGNVADAIKSGRARHFIDGDVVAPSGLEWTVLYRDVTERPDPIYGRTVFVRPIGDLAGLHRHVDRNTQAVGLALSGARRADIASSLADAGVDRITEPGAMATFAAPWDGLFPVELLVRWVSLRN